VRLTREFYARAATVQIARELIGMHLVHEDRGRRRIGRIVETEAYRGPQDLAAHSARGRTARTTVLFGPPGHAYVYLIYGMWNCLNVVTAPAGIPHAVLLRALEPVQNLAEPSWGPGVSVSRDAHRSETERGGSVRRCALARAARLRGATDCARCAHRSRVRRRLGAAPVAVF